MGDPRFIAFHTAGSRTYGAAWRVMRPALVFLHTDGRALSSKDLTGQELEAITRRLDQTPPLWPRTPESLHKWADDERYRADLLTD